MTQAVASDTLSSQPVAKVPGLIERQIPEVKLQN
jgi:hypothetical protein